MPEPSSKSNLDPTRLRLLESAEALFAERGFEATSIRSIVEAAGTNIAAVNYHFGSKDRLYIEAVKYAFRFCSEGEPFPDWPPGTPAEQKLRDFIVVKVRRMMDASRPVSLQLVMRELAQPTEACSEMVDEYIRPTAKILAGILVELLPPGTSERQSYLFAFSIVGQCLFYKQNRSIIERMIGLDELRELSVDQIADHIANVALAALRDYRGRGPGNPGGPP